ncbi:16S rRNA (cytosine(1402)-N(4))-methyltransferase RsmH [Jannaschia aquimarina]|uniref:Ribosomal RNA small subunit methyltransferase H n=1 Tax=Jannaschia aquimarina TaxID=935700 RepID=A0A0D1EIW3_9RHOB|nr:16S rRNA (cytosine(1402)-N(4))-methyltransferase RsmH [Jannaschia aquimarina]KIT16831.1 Ribosomal RNA small subunit methyltransferase H [Jannaschia aquimarina]SNT13368.1 16S rRNA (cytosine1402-N4)-methyltransferase [Jannaschia aquimarina]
MSKGTAPHVPVLINAILRVCAPIRGVWLDGTMGAGGYARALLDAGAERLIGLDRDPLAHEMAATWADGRVETHLTEFSRLDEFATGLDGVVLDLGVSSMQLDRAERGFSFLRDGPLDMRMAGEGPTAAELVNTASEADLADILHRYGEERAARRIARAIVRRREDAPFERTLDLADVIAGCLPRPKPGQVHPATRSFQAIRIAVNDELGELHRGLMAAERALAPGGWLAVVTFHSLEDRAVKRFLADRSDAGGGGSRHAPAAPVRDPAFADLSKAISPDADEVAANPRARSARLRVARRTHAPAAEVPRATLGLPEPIRLIHQ